MNAAGRVLGIAGTTIARRFKRAGPDEAEMPRLDFPVLTSENPTAEELLSLRERETDRVLRAAADRRWMPIAVRDSGPIGVLWYGDPHIDDPGCDIRALQRDVALVKGTPGLYAAAIGDMTNNWIGRLGALYGSQQTTEAQAWILVEWFVKEQAGHWLALIGGNHDAWSGVGDPLRWITRHASAHYEPDEVTMRLQFPGGQEFRVAARHDFPGHSFWNPSHGGLRAGQMTHNADLIISGHRHTGGYQMFTVPHSGNICHAVQLGAYKLEDHYARQKGFPNRHIAPSVITVLDPNATPSARVQVFHDTSLGADYLTFLRKRR
jgi:hypothetical protein